MARHFFSGGVEAKDHGDGLLIRQNGEAYIARNWRLSPATEELIATAISSGFGCMIREDHPRKNARWPNPRGVVYLAFSPTPHGQWSLAVDTFREGRGDFGHAVFNGKYHTQFVVAGLPFKFEKRNKGAGHLVVARQHVLPTIKALAEFDHSVLALNRSPHDGEGFTTEYVLQRQVLTSWAETPWGPRYDIVQDEFPVDGGLTSRRIDILARDRRTGDWLIIELKRAEATLSAVHQIAGYLLALRRRDDFADSRVEAALVAERVPASVRVEAEGEGISVYEVRWPLTLLRVA